MLPLSDRLVQSLQFPVQVHLETKGFFKTTTISISLTLNIGLNTFDQKDIHIGR